MYPVSHILVAAAMARAGERALRRRSNGPSTTTPVASGVGVDYRLVAFGALLPDIIDRSLTWVLLPDSFEDNHIFAHTLLFSLVIALPGLYFARRGDLGLLSVAAGTLTHLLADPVLREPRTLLWPLFGTKFHDTTGLGFGRPEIVIMDIVAAAGLLFAGWRLLVAGRLREFVRSGRL